MSEPSVLVDEKTKAQVHNERGLPLGTVRFQAKGSRKSIFDIPKNERFVASSSKEPAHDWCVCRFFCGLHFGDIESNRSSWSPVTAQPS